MLVRPTTRIYNREESPSRQNPELSAIPVVVIERVERGANIAFHGILVDTTFVRDYVDFALKIRLLAE